MAKVVGLSVIIPVWDQTSERADLTHKCIEAVWTHAQIPTEVIIIDNASAFRRPHRASTRINNPTNRGIAPAWNQGVEKAHGKYYCFLNSDCLVFPGWDVALVKCAASDFNAAMPLTDGAKSDGIGITGWCFVVSADSFNRVGLFDETFVPCFYEDTDWFHRLLHAGGRMFSVPDSNVSHDRNSDRTGKAALLFTANRLRYAWKHDLDPNKPPHFWTKPLADWKP